MSLLAHIRIVLALPAMLPLGAIAQTAQPVPAAVRLPFPRVQPPKNINFTNSKPILGWPGDAGTSYAHCALDGTTFLQASADSKSPGADGIPDVYSISGTAELKRLRRTLPTDFELVGVKDFFVGDHGLVTLLQGARRAAREGDPPQETTYFVSLSDLDGDGSKLLRLDVKFRPIKIALLPSGQMLALGWEAANALPVLAVLKEDGTLRSFVDLDSHKSPTGHEQRFSASLLEAAPAHGSAAGVLEHAAFVATRGAVLLTFPFTSLPVRVLNDLGETSMVPLHLPPGFVLHDVLNTGADRTWVVRAQINPTLPQDKSEPQDKPQPPEIHMYAIESLHGSLVKEYILDQPLMPQVSCAANNKLTAIFKEAIPDASASTAPQDKGAPPPEASRQWVVSTVPR